jgi:molecular chaperone DnaK
MRLLGIDFGTSNTVGAVATTRGPVRLLLFDGSPVLPSAVYLSPDGRLLVGRDAQRSWRLHPGRFEPNPKRRVDDGTVLLGDQPVPVARLVAAVLARVLTEARRQLGAAPDLVRLTHPEQWGQRRRAVLLDAARRAGLGPVRLVAEPVAAAAYYAALPPPAPPGVPPGSGRVPADVAVYDLGAGTFDAAVVRAGPGGFQVLAEGGLPDVGGLDFDQAVVEHLRAGHAGADPAGWQGVLNPADPQQRRDRQLFYDDVRGAKEMLSRAASADIALPAGPPAHLTRGELERLLLPYLEQTVRCLRDTVARAGLGPGELAGVFLVGGSSRIPLVARLIHTSLGVAPTVLEQPETAVVEGAVRLDPPGPQPPTGAPARSPAGTAMPARSPAGTARPAPASTAAALTPPRRAGAAARPWYREPLLVATLTVLALVVAAFAVLLAVAA